MCIYTFRAQMSKALLCAVTTFVSSLQKRDDVLDTACIPRCVSPPLCKFILVHVTLCDGSVHCDIYIEVRDSWTEYLVPARDGSGLLPDWESSWDIAAAAVTWKFRLTFRLGIYIWSFQIGIWLIWEIFGLWYRGSTQNSEPDLSSIVIWLGQPFWNTCLFSKYFQK